MTTSSITAEAHSQPRLRGFALASVLTALMLTLFLEALDQTVVGTAMPRIIDELHGMDRYSWVVTAYILASMTMIPIVGKLSDQFGRKWFLLFGTGLFLLGSILAGTSQSMNQLIIFRAVQGLGSGIGIALIGTVMADLFPPDQRAKWSGLFGLVYGVSSLCGPLIGGWLAEHGPLLGSLVTESTRWRWVFYINVPLGLIAVVALLIYLPDNLSVRTSSWSGWTSLRSIDFLGAVLCGAATICVMLGLTWGGAQASNWTSLPVLSILVAGMLLFTLFIYTERRAHEPIIPLDLFRNQIFSVGAVLTLIQGMVLLGLSLYLPLYFQGVLAVSPTSAGLIMTPFSVSMVVGAILSTQLIGKFKGYQIVTIVSALLMSVGTFLITFLNAQTNITLAIAILVLTGIGIGPFFSLPMVVVQNALPADRLGVSTAGLRYLGQLGASLGIAIVGTLVTSSVSGDLINNFPTTIASKVALSTALQHGFLAVMIFALIALAASFLLKELPLRTTLDQPLSESTTQENGKSSLETIQA
jgi:EmrB/QacA subfamily drug resistance transporter